MQDTQNAIFPPGKPVSEIPWQYYKQKLSTLSTSCICRTVQLNWELCHPHTAYPGDDITTFITTLILNAKHLTITPIHLRDCLAKIQAETDFSKLTNLH
jgi:hypothetical protein